MQIGSYKINKLSGPTNLSFIKPTKDLQNFLGSSFSTPLLLLGDYHHSDIKSCEDLFQLDRHSSTGTYQTIRNSFISLISDEWFRLLDKVSSYQNPIDYFIEISLLNKQMAPTFVPPSEQVIQSVVDNMLDMIMKANKDLHQASIKIDYEKRINEIRNFFRDDKTVMNYIVKNHTKCFHSSSQEESCFTKNIRYHSSDVRHSNYKSDCIESKIDKRMEDILLSRTSLKCEVDNIDLHELIFLACTNWKSFAIKLVDSVLSYKRKSCIYKQIVKQENPNIQKWRSFCIEYIESYSEYLYLIIPFFDDLKKDILNIMQRHSIEVSDYKRRVNSIKTNSILQKLTHSVSPVVQYTNLDINNIYLFQTFIFSPLFEIHFL